MTRRRGEGPWWVTEVLAPLLILALFFLALGLGSILAGPS